VSPSVADGERWEKLGRVYVASGERPWCHSHAVLPTVLKLRRDRLRVYVAFLDQGLVGRLGFVEVDARDPRRVLAVSAEPVLDIGADGTFDDNGVTPMSIVRSGDALLLYYTGWQLGRKARYFLFTGVAKSLDGGLSFQRMSQVPLLDRCDGELFVRTACFVCRDQRRWRMWYIGGDRWIEVNGKLVPSYNLRYLESNVPARWTDRPGRILMDLQGTDEYGFGRPFVVRSEDRYQLWYSIRSVSKGYRIGYAESPDGLEWSRQDDRAGIDVSTNGWDSEMICYASVVATRYGTYMFYNGNNYGETGFGVAVLR
jgi:predicted GH43/DUF377 family glycosyl hydrolase